jgi:signal peptidase I
VDILRKIYSILIDLVETLVVAAAIFVIVYFFLFRPFQVNGQSMFPNYHDGEYILTNLVSLHLSSLKRGDVVVFQAPVDAEKDFIKRVIGLPGETVALKDGSVYIDGKRLDESDYLPPDFKTFAGSFLAEGQTVTVPEGKYFVLGDNRNFSSDSREWGYVTREKVIGKSFFVYWPLNRIRLVKRGAYPN